MKRPLPVVAAVAVFVTCALMSVTADEWRLPTPRDHYSPNRQYRVEVIPRALESQLAFFQDKVDGREPAGSLRGAEAQKATARFQVRPPARRDGVAWLWCSTRSNRWWRRR